VIVTLAASRSHRAASVVSVLWAAPAEDAAVCEAASTPPNEQAAVAKIKIAKNFFIIAPENKNTCQQHAS
jgi:hypothetical protein